MPVVRLDLAYDGSRFRGWARQRGQRTVQGVLEEALGKVLGSPPELSVAGRTDAGVHASGQVASFAWEGRSLDLARLQRSANGQLGPEVVVHRARWASEGFDARFSATGRCYRYRIRTAETSDPFTAPFEWHRPGSPSIPSMRAAARPLIGEHDFASFCRKPPAGGTVRRLRRVAVTRTEAGLDVVVEANAFCHQMVRSLVGTLVAAGDGKVEAADVARFLVAKDRAGVPQLAPPYGLTLERVTYGRGRDSGSG
jgi:tRNA pseudouridine38-40 synthase